MPISEHNRGLYPPNWKTIRANIIARAKGRCERCCVFNHAVGYRDASGGFNGACEGLAFGWRDAGKNDGNMSGVGLTNNFDLLTYKEARRIADEKNDCNGRDSRGNHWIVIVLTVAHLDHDPRNNAPENLQALCQSCHNRHDAKHRAANRAKTMAARKAESRTPDSECPLLGENEK